MPACDPSPGQAGGAPGQNKASLLSEFQASQGLLERPPPHDESTDKPNHPEILSERVCRDLRQMDTEGRQLGSRQQDPEGRVSAEPLTAVYVT